MRILFCGMFKSPFILQDFKLLQKVYKVIPINLDIVWDSREGFIIYLLTFVTDIIFKLYKSDIVYIWFADIHAVPLLLLSKVFRKKSILTIGGLEVANFPEIKYGNQLNWRGIVAKWCIRNANIIIVPSLSYKNITEFLVPNTKIFVIPNAIDDSLIHYPLLDKQQRVVTALYSLKDTGVLKGIPTFKEAVTQLPYDFEIYDGISHDKLIDELRKSKVYCQLSYTESFGITNVEAMACGCIPVVTNRDELPAIIGDSGIVVPYGDVKATVEAIKKAMSMDSYKARDRAKYYTNERRLKMLEEVIDY